MAIKTLVVDDEPLAREGLAMMLADETDIEVVALCPNANSAIAMIQQHQPDLVFLDIQMPKMSGFDVVQKVVQKIGEEKMPLVVFVTAYDQYAVEAFSVHAMDYLLKPVRKSRLQESLVRIREQLLQKDLRQNGKKLGELLSMFDQHKGTDSPPSVASNGSDNDRIVVKSHGHIYFLQTSEILWIEASGDYVTIHTEQKSHLLRDTMRNMEVRLDSHGFKRIHRSAIINLSFVSELKSGSNNDYNVVLSDGTVLNLGRSYKDSLYSSLGGLE
ncbi:MAG: LytTR family DNA-binding domain-containing protein [Pseudomonadales bacterium]|nr:LytTR family DNA-binding domain-containing protein [Pseudomonadales bacterium]